jgi:polyhydroxyalkanoate synthesis regulator phasin
VVRRTYLNNEEAANSVKELVQRVKNLSKYRDEANDDMARMMAMLKVASADLNAKPTTPGAESEITPDMLKDVIADMQREGAEADDDAPFDPSDEPDEDSN